MNYLLAWQLFQLTTVHREEFIFSSYADRTYAIGQNGCQCQSVKFPANTTVEWCKCAFPVAGEGNPPPSSSAAPSSASSAAPSSSTMAFSSTPAAKVVRAKVSETASPDKKERPNYVEEHFEA